MKTAETFDLKKYLLKVERRWPRWRENPETRRLATKRDPLLFALVYLPHHLKGKATGDRITFGDAHLAWAEGAKRWMKPVTKPAQDRTCSIAPREMGKSTWHFLIRPLWGAAHGWVRFVAAFADSSTQAETHLQTFTHELETNLLLREDFPELVTPLRRAGGATAADSKSLYRATSGFSFAAKGIDSGTLGLKVGEDRPDLLILDDIEPGESNYSLFQMKKRLSTIQDVIFPLNVFARVDIVGTVTMPGSIVHQLVKSARGIETQEWIKDEKIRSHYFPPIVVEKNGRERSIWPAKWSMKFFSRIRHTRAFAKNYANDPMGADGDYWTSDDFKIGHVEGVTRTAIFVDPAVTTRSSSDFTGLSVVGYSPSRRKVLLKEAVAVKLSGAHLRHKVLLMIEADPTIRAIIIEANQGGEVWKEIFHNMPVPVVTFWSGAKKEVRAADTLNDYQLGNVIHAKELTALQEQMVAFPGAPNDDLVDAACSGIAFFLHPKKKIVAGGRGVDYA